MNKDRMLAVLVLADVVLAFSVIGAELAFQWTLPGPLRAYAMSDRFSLSSPWDVRLTLLWVACIACTVVSWIGLLNYWRFARRLYVVGWAAWTLLVLLSGPSVRNPVGAMFDTVESVVAGAILGLVFFSDLSRHFERRPERVASTA